MGSVNIPESQTVALVRELGGPVEFQRDYPVPSPKHNEVLAQVLYTGVCQSDLHTRAGTANGPDGRPITKIKLPHVGGHEGIGRIVKLGPGVSEDVQVGTVVGIRFSSRICRRCEFCLAGKEQHCIKSTNHLHHEDGSFQEYIALDADYLTILPSDIDPVVMGPTLCAGLTAYKAVLNCGVVAAQWCVVVGAGGGLGHYAVQYLRAFGARVIGVDAGAEKCEFAESLGAERTIDVLKTADLIQEVHELTSGGAQAVIVTAGNARAFSHAPELLKIGGTLSCCGIPPGKCVFDTPVSAVVIRGLKIVGNLVGNLKECMEAVEFVRLGKVKPKVKVMQFEELSEAYDLLEKGHVLGRIVLKVADRQ